MAQRACAKHLTSSIFDDAARAAAGSQPVTKLFGFGKAVEAYTDCISGLASEPWISAPDHCRFLLGEYGGILLLEPGKDC